MTTTSTIDVGEGGALFGAPLPIFKGDRSKATNFLLAFKGWRATNSQKKAMVLPYTRVTVALTFIKGENVQDWKEHKLDLLEERVLNGHAKTEEYLWTEFEKAFKAAFKDTSRMLNTQTQLDTLKQDKEGVKQYTVTFNCLLKQAGFNEDNKDPSIFTDRDSYLDYMKHASDTSQCPHPWRNGKKLQPKSN
jgi:hypothetical protein